MPHPSKLPQLAKWSPSVTAEKVFTAEDCARVLALSKRRTSGVIGLVQTVDPEYRASDVSWIRPTKANNWIFKKTFEVVRQANQRYYRMELSGYTEPYQITEYTANGHYDWHLDFGSGPFSVRKLSFIVQLSDPTDYDGGQVEFLYSRKPRVALKDQGSMILFPSFLLHRVKPVTRGTRFSLVGWIGGPHYR